MLHAYGLNLMHKLRRVINKMWSELLIHLLGNCSNCKASISPLKYNPRILHEHRILTCIRHSYNMIKLKGEMKLFITERLALFIFFILKRVYQHKHTSINGSRISVLCSWFPYDSTHRKSVCVMPSGVKTLRCSRRSYSGSSVHVEFSRIGGRMYAFALFSKRTFYKRTKSTIWIKFNQIQFQLLLIF